MKKLVICLFIFLCCCKKNNSNIYPSIGLSPDVPGDTVLLDSFPTTATNSWTYKIEEQNSANLKNTNTYYVTVNVASDTIVNGYRLIKVTSQNNANTIFMTPDYDEEKGSPSYFLNNKTGLFYLPSIKHIDTSYINDSAELFVQYPSRVPLSWSQPMAYTGKWNYQWLGYVKVVTPAGTFNCAKLQVNGGIYTAQQYYSSKGLIQEIQIENEATHLPGEGYTVYKRVVTLQKVNF